jgi:hypothetical protein
MHLKRTPVIVVSLLLILMVMTFVQPAAAQDGKQVYAFYFGWWTNDSWGNDALTDHPQQLYDSRDPNALAHHIDQAKSAGIDAFIMSWFGPKNGNLTAGVFNMLLDQAAPRGFHVGAVVDMFQNDYNESTGAVLDSLRYLIGDRINHPAYLRYHGKPLIFFWNEARFSVEEWQNIRAQVDPNHNTIWVAEGTSAKYIPTFDGLYLFNTAWASNPGATARQYLSKVQKAGGSFFIPTALPGWDETRVAARDGRKNPTAPKDRANGAFLTKSWNGALSAGTDAILVVSWNEYFENSEVEPSQLYGSQALDTLRGLIGAWKGTGGGNTAAAAPPAPTGKVVVPTTTVNVRAAPDKNSASLGKVEAGTALAFTDDSGDWFAVNFNGQQGYVSKKYARIEQH